MRTAVLEHGEAPAHTEHQKLLPVDDDNRALRPAELADRAERHQSLQRGLSGHGHDDAPSALTMSRVTCSTASSNEHSTAPWTSQSSANRPVSTSTTAAATVGSSFWSAMPRFCSCRIDSATWAVYCRCLASRRSR